MPNAKNLKNLAKAAMEDPEDDGALAEFALEAPEGLDGKPPREFASAYASEDEDAAEADDEEGALRCAEEALLAEGVDAVEAPALAAAVLEKLRQDGYLSV